MRTRILAVLMLCACLALPQAARAEKWYHQGWVIGPASFLAGGVVGYVVGKHDSGYRRVYSTPVYPSCGSPSYDPIHTTGAYYVREKRAFPFYHKTEIFPIASTMPAVPRPQAVSMADQGWGRSAYSTVDENAQAGTAKGLEINIGDNNQNVTVNIGHPGGADSTAAGYRVETIPNHPSLPGRVVDVKVPVDLESVPPADATTPPAEQPTEAATTEEQAAEK